MFEIYAKMYQQMNSTHYFSIKELLPQLTRGAPVSTRQLVELGVRPQRSEDVKNGTNCLTTPIRGKRDGCVVTMSGTHYKLLDVDPVYEALYPGARERLMNTLPSL